MTTYSQGKLPGPRTQLIIVAACFLVLIATIIITKVAGI